MIVTATAEGDCERACQPANVYVLCCSRGVSTATPPTTSLSQPLRATRHGVPVVNVYVSLTWTTCEARDRGGETKSVVRGRVKSVIFFLNSVVPYSSYLKLAPRWPSFVLNADLCKKKIFVLLGKVYMHLYGLKRFWQLNTNLYALSWQQLRWYKIIKDHKGTKCSHLFRTNPMSKSKTEFMMIADYLNLINITFTDQKILSILIKS